MPVNLPSEAYWNLLHQAKAVLIDRGYAGPCPPVPLRLNQPQESLDGYEDLVGRYGQYLAFGQTWPEGRGNPRPRALVLAGARLTDEAFLFIRSWFENPRVQMTAEEHLWVQVLPELTGEPSVMKDFARDLCRLLQPKAILSLGARPAQQLLGAPLRLETLRGSDYRFDQWSVVTTLDPEDFAGLPADQQQGFKGQVWRDLQRLLGKLRYG